MSPREAGSWVLGWQLCGGGSFLDWTPIIGVQFRRLVEDLSWGETGMVKLNVSIDEQVREELFRLVPPRRRSQVVNEALRKELLSRKRQNATEAIHRLRKRSATLSGEEITAAVRRDRARADR